MSLTIRIIRPSSREKIDLLPARIKELNQIGIQVIYDETAQDSSWPFTAAPASIRAKSLEDALAETKSDVVISARGGYGMSDLLSLLDWDRLSSAKPKLMIGFSDVSALHSSLYTILGWKSLHAPMPATTLWNKDGEVRDVEQLATILKTKKYQGGISVTSYSNKNPATVEGWLFGGCMSVLTALIGTPYFPKSLDGSILFLEDVGENPGRMMRYWNQWLQSNVVKGVKAIVLGQFRDLTPPGDEATMQGYLYREFASRCRIPVYTSSEFGHVSPNFPMMIGADARIEKDKLSWKTSDLIRNDLDKHSSANIV